MSVNTVLLDFSIEPSTISDEIKQKDLLKMIIEILEKYFPQNLKIIWETTTSDGYLFIFNERDGVILTLRFFNVGLITINIEYYKIDQESPIISFEV